MLLLSMSTLAGAMVIITLAAIFIPDPPHPLEEDRLPDNSLLLSKMPKRRLACASAVVQDTSVAERDEHPDSHDPTKATPARSVYGVQRQSRRGPPPRDVQGLRLPGVWLMRVALLQRCVPPARVPEAQGRSPAIRLRIPVGANVTRNLVDNGSHPVPAF
ncbi:hypothetical protein ONZ51_g833 [Trametes cubensis]|uniref:Uncharacterized protein n=1 Tax=Trametes cubensis TaxID=1111947 RepID=A0AAD7U3G3_9APHY|nr:hypothetical protein ONZ51_g833 [Trametes cubensis]